MPSAHIILPSRGVRFAEGLINVDKLPASGGLDVGLPLEISG